MLRFRKTPDKFYPVASFVVIFSPFVSQTKRVGAADTGDIPVRAVADAVGAAVVTLTNIRLISDAVNVVQKDASWTSGEYSRVK